ncbi:putative ribonuclease H-like domain-containing protein [Tanacetum coccineum]
MSSTNSTNEVNTSYGVSTANTQASTTSTRASTANLSDDTVYAFLATLLSMRTRKFFQKTGRKITNNGSDTARYDKSKVECFNCHKLGHFARECRGPRNQDNMSRNQDSSKRTINVEEISSKAMLAIDGADEEVPSDMALMAFSDSENEILFSKQLAVLKRDISYKDSEISVLKSELEKLKQDKESNQLKIENFDYASKNLDKLIGSQIPDKSRKGLRFVSYNVVSPPPIGLFSPLTIDLSNSGLEEFQQPEFKGSGPKISKSVSKDVSNEVRKSPDALMVEELVSDGHPQQEDQSYVDSGCSRHMIGNMSYLSYFKEFDGGYVTFGGGAKGGRITGKGTVKTVPRKNDMYSVDMKNIVPKECLTCLVAKATLEESMLWHRRLGHINFKNINKLVKDNLARGLPTKCFENDQTYVACLKGKQHKASCNSKIQNSISQPLFMLHMDLFGPTFVSSLMNKKYCLVATDDYSRFTWVFFLSSKDETSDILKSFITQIENLVDKKVKIIRCDNETEFKNRVMIAERRNRTLIEAARTMLADSKLPTTFWAEAINTACYVQNRVLVVKHHNKTLYERFRGRTHALCFMRPFGCHVTILNTLNHLGKFDGKSDDGFFVGYSLNSKAFRVYNIRTRKVEENLHVRFLEDKPIITGDGSKWLFDIYVLTESMNYVPVVAGTNSNDFIDGSLFDSSSKNANNDELQPFNDAGNKNVEGGIDNHERPKKSAQDVNIDGPSINTASINNNTGSLNINTSSPIVTTTPTETTHDDYFEDETELDMGNISTTYPVPSTPNTRIHKDHSLDNEEPKRIAKALSDSAWVEAMQEELLQFKLQKGYTQEEGINYDEVFAPIARIKAIRLFLAYASFMGFMVYQMDVKSAFLYGQIEEEVYVCQPLGFEDPDNLDKVYKVVKALYGLHQAPRAWYETLAKYLLDKGFHKGKIDPTLFIKKQKGDILRVQVYVDDIIFGSTKKELCIEFEKLMHDKF